jgi:hypothetical protein
LRPFPPAAASGAAGTIARDVAKKTRTPPPPRRVQAPKTRTQSPKQRAGSTPAVSDQQRRMVYLVGILGIVALAAVVIFLYTRGSATGHGKPHAVDFATLPGLQTGKPPWNTGVATLDERLQPLGLKALTAEGTVIHIHQHLDVYVDGKHVTVPAGIGIQPSDYLTTLHTHDSAGIIHLESPTAENYSLGQFFGVWGVKLTSQCVGGACGGVKLYVNGKLHKGDPAKLVLKAHQELVLVVGKGPKKIPKSYNFAPGI